MKKGYWVAHVSSVKDQELFQKYFDATGPLVERGDYKLVCLGPTINIQRVCAQDLVLFLDREPHSLECFECLTTGFYRIV